MSKVFRSSEWQGDWHEIFEYKEGHLVNKVNRGYPALEGSYAGTLRRDGYIGVYVFGKYYWAHHIIWELFNGPVPPGMQVDHVDRDPSNCNISNLRLATPSQNTMNRATPSSITSGYKGVSWHKQKQRWVAQVGVNGKSKFLGFYDDAAAANEVCIAFHEELHKEFAQHK